jgi:hypothetical protein
MHPGAPGVKRMSISDAPCRPDQRLLFLHEVPQLLPTLGVLPRSGTSRPPVEAALGDVKLTHLLGVEGDFEHEIP